MDILLLFSSILPMIHMKPPPKIAIIGGGIGGFSAAYFINEILPEATIDVYEKDGRIGGRMRSVELIGEKYEAGASIIHDKNLYMKKFREKFNLKKREKLSSNGVFVYVGRNRIEYPTGYSFKALLNFPFLNDFVNAVRFVFSCGVWDFFKLYFNTRRLLKNFVRIYEYQANGTSFETIDELLKSLPGLHQLTKISLEDYLRRDLGLGSRILTNLILPAIRVNYGQDLDVPALVGMISLAASLDGSALWSVQGGNELFVRFIYNYLSFNETILYGASPNGHGSNLYHHPDFLVDHDGCHLQGQPRNRKFNLYTGTNLVGMVYNNETATYELSFNQTGCRNHLDRDNSSKLYDTVILATPFPFIFPDVYPSPTTIEAGGDIKWCLNLDVSNSDHTFECLDEANPHTDIENKALRNNDTVYRGNNLLRYHTLWVYLVDRKTADPSEDIFGPVKAKNWLFPLISSRPYSYVDGIFTSRVNGTGIDKNENAPLSNISRLETLFNSIGLQAPVTFGQKKTPKNTNSDISDDDSHHTYYEKKINDTGPEIGALQELDGYSNGTGCGRLESFLQ
ncbi:uncharacterized protein LOC135928016 [Gordionus sp. m RMFG-2023]|uniref:uncharacterized protein LOC135928016 n=1 Tax=Gordionus sp. m RMFG-2023 TaxID=3053472 RepID=UPI0031FD80E4